MYTYDITEWFVYRVFRIGWGQSLSYIKLYALVSGQYDIKHLVSYFVSFVLFFFIFSSVMIAINEKKQKTIENKLNDDQIVAPKKYDLVTSKQNVSSEDYTIDFKITSDWGQGFNGEISIMNNTEEVIEDWILEFDFDRNIQSFWTAEIAEHAEDHYIIKNAVYNAKLVKNGGK